ncbi:Rho termination factor N-terminal domain-containing protein, partial [Kitasatospora sp. NPDC004289]
MSDSTDLMGARPDAEASDAANAPAAPARRRRTAAAGLDGLVLAELQKLASTLGISGTGRLRKSQLIEAIKEKSGGDPLPFGERGGGEHGNFARQVQLEAEEVEIRYTGLRAGEKLNEALF